MGSYFKNVKESFKLKHYVNYIALTLFLIISASLFYSGAMKRSTADLFYQIGISIILAVSLNLVVGFLGELSLGHAGFMCVGAYLGGYFGNLLYSLGLPKLLVLIITMLIGGAAAGLFGFIVGLPALRLKGDYLAIVTLAFGEIVRNICKNIPAFGGALGLATTSYGRSIFVVTFVVVILMLAVVQNIARSKHGRAVTAIRDNEIAAKAMGINVTYYKLFIFIISAFFAGVAGAIYGNYVTPILYSSFSYNYSIEILVMVVLGGMGSINGSIIAAALLTFIDFTLTKNLSGDLAALKFLIYALILILMVIYKNAPALKKYRERFNTRVLFEKLRAKLAKPRNAATITDDSASWDVIPTKIKTDEVLSTDFTLSNYNPDKPSDKQGGGE